MADTADPTGPPVLHLGQGPLVGRGRELAALAHALEEARAGRASVVLLAGEPGIGKSRLLEEFPPPPLAAGVTVLRGGASQAEGMPPYLPFLEALGEYVARAGLAALREAVGPSAGILTALLPEIPARLGAPPSPYPLAPEQERLRLYEAVVAFLAAIAARGALVLAFDDLHWADTATCELLVHVARRLRSAPLLVVGTYREGEAEDNRAFTRALAELNRQRRLLTLPLPPFDEAESGRLVASLLHGEPAPALGVLLHRHGEGNPFFEEEVLRALVEAGALAWRGDHWALGPVPDRLLPPGLLGAIRLRLSRLAPEVVDLLHVAAVAGRTCQVGVLAAATGRDPEEVEELLLTAARARVVRPDAAGGYAFAHDKVREALYAEVGEARRRRLHRAIGEALEAQEEATSPRRLADLAFHFVQAGDTALGVRHALAAGAQALRASAAREAVEHYRQAVGLLTGAVDEAPRAAALAGLAEAATAAGDDPLAAESYQQAGEAYLRAGDAAGAARAWRRLGDRR